MEGDIGGVKRNSIRFHSDERWRITRNIAVISFAFMLHFTAFHGTANLQSSVNSDANIGTLTLAAIYISLLVSNIVLPTMVISWIGCKWAIAISFVAYMPFICAQFYPKAYVLLPAGLMVGLGGGPLWCAKCTYLTVIAETYAGIVGQSVDVMVTRFFGFFFMFYQMAQVWGNLITSTVLSSDSSNATASQYPWDNGVSFENYDNVSLNYIEKIKNNCGAYFSGATVSTEDNSNIAPPDINKIYLISGIFLVCMATASFLVSIGSDSLKRYTNKKGVPKGSAISQLLATLKHTREPYQLLILPATAFIGAEQAFMIADYNFAYVACAYGIKNIGYVMIIFGIFNAIMAVVAGSIVKITGRFPVMVVALMLHLSIFVALLYWRPRPDAPQMFFAMAALWGAADAIWLVQVNALSGILFPGKEAAAYSSFRLWEATGSVMAYTMSPFLATHFKIYIILVILIVGMAGYTVVEVMERKAKAGLPKGHEFELVRTKNQTPAMDTD